MNAERTVVFPGWLRGHLFCFSFPARILSPLTRLLVVLCVAAVVSRSPGQPPPSRALHTKVRLVADAQAVVPGEAFTLGILMRMDKGWHTYWKNPGDAGLATQVEWTAPAGFTVGEIRWPLPHKYRDSGDVVSFGYAGENMLLVPVSAPASLRPGGTVTLTARVQWLECEHICVPGEAAVRLTLPVRAKAVPANSALFSQYGKEIPPSYTPDGRVALSVSLVNGSVRIRLVPLRGARFAVDAEAKPDFYPEVPDDVLIGRTGVAAAADSLIMTVPVTASKPLTGTIVLRGVLLYRLTEGPAEAVALEVPLRADSLAPAGGGSGPGLSLLDQSFDVSHSAAQPLALYIVFALLGGLLLNIMPCVLPVIALKVFGLVRMAGDRPGRVTRLGWAFAGGILASFLLLALAVILLQLAGEQVGWGFQFQEPRFVIAMAALVFAFGLSLFGVYEIRLPGAALAGLSSVVAGPEQSATGYGASFGEGVFATVLATPCTAPFLGSALGFAFAEPWWIILLIFTSVALGMALPYLVLTARPAWIRFLPKPGAWMETGKQLMGFLMMATLLWLLYILGRQLGMEAVIWTGAFLLSVGLACWLIGRFATLTASKAATRTVWGAALLIVAAGYVLFFEAGLDLRAAIAGVKSDADAPGAAEGIAWKPFSLAALQEDLKGASPVFVDFTADWCLTCKVNEKTVIATKQVIDRFKALNVVAVRADWTNRNPDITRLLSKFGRSGVPLYVIFPPGRSHAPIILPEVITAGMVLEALDKAGSP